MNDLQTAIDQARAENPEAVLAVDITHRLEVTEAPLRLGSKTCVTLRGDGALVVAARCTATRLIAVEEAEFVSILSGMANGKRGVLDGSGRVATGIDVSGSGRVVIDTLDIRHCTTAAIRYRGNGDTVVDESGSVTRCHLVDCPAGLIVREAARFICMGNEVYGYSLFGLDVESADATIVGNRCVGTGSGVGLRFNEPAERPPGPRSTVGSNELRNHRCGLSFGEGSTGVLVTQNTVVGNGVGIAVSGARNLIYQNTLNNDTEFEITSPDSIVASHPGVLAGELPRLGPGYFNPPTAANVHQDPVIVSGRGRHDLEVIADEAPTPLGHVQARIDAARAARPDDYLVVHLNGTFVVGKGVQVGLDLPAHTCVVLYGALVADGMDSVYQKAPQGKGADIAGGRSIAVRMTKPYSAFSGGEIRCGNSANWGVYASGKALQIIDSVHISDARSNNIGTLGHRGATTPLFISNCRLTGTNPRGLVKTNRGVWVHVCDNVHCIGLSGGNHVADLVDFDAGARGSSLLFSTATRNRRTLAFVEEGASRNVVIGNHAPGDRLTLYDSRNHRQISHNFLIGNTCSSISCRQGIESALVFGNTCTTGSRMDYTWRSPTGYVAMNHHAGTLNVDKETELGFFAPYVFGGTARSADGAPQAVERK